MKFITLKRSEMPLPREMRWEMLKRAQDHLVEQYGIKTSTYKEKLAKSIDPGIYPDFPTLDEILALAEEMKTFVEIKQ